MWCEGSVCVWCEGSEGGRGKQAEVVRPRRCSSDTTIAEEWADGEVCVTVPVLASGKAGTGGRRGREAGRGLREGKVRAEREGRGAVRVKERGERVKGEGIEEKARMRVI